MTRMDQVFKAYDVRGTVPDQLDATMCQAIGRAMARFAGAPEILMARDMRESGVELSKAFSDGVRAEGVNGHRPGHGVHGLPLLRRRPSRCARRDVHRFAQSGPVQRDQAVPLGRPPDRSRHRPGRDSGDGREPAGRASGRADRVLARAQPARRVGRARDLLRRPGRPAAAQGRRRHGQRHGRAGRADRLLPPPVLGRHPLSRARRQLSQPSGRPDPAREPGRPQGGGAGRRGPTSVWPSTATPTGSSWSTSAPNRCRAR